MASTCISTCIEDTKVPIRPTYKSRFKWPESDAEFIRSLRPNGGSRTHPAVVDSFACRQMYLRSYKFHRDDDDHQTEPEKTKCFGRVHKGRKKKPPTFARKNEVSCAALLAVFHRLLFCTTRVDVAHHGG